MGSLKYPCKQMLSIAINCLVFEKTAFLCTSFRRQTDRWTDRQMDGRMDGQTDGQTETDSQTDGQHHRIKPPHLRVGA